MSNIRLVALDLDGTLFNEQSKISPACREAIRRATEAGVYVVISSGRPMGGIPIPEFEGTGIRYAITTNGAGVYELATRKCIFEDCMEPEFILPIAEYLETKQIHMDFFIHGDPYSSTRCKEIAKKLDMPEALRRYIIETRIRKDDMIAFIRDNQLSVQKMTLNFCPLPDGSFLHREEIRQHLLSNPELSVVSGGYHNLEFTKSTVNKGVGLQRLAEYLGIPMDQTMAIGDTENDISIIQAAGLGVAMGNAIPEVKVVADVTTSTNEEDGVAKALYRFIPGI